MSLSWRHHSDSPEPVRELTVVSIHGGDGSAVHDVVTFGFTLATAPQQRQALGQRPVDGVVLLSAIGEAAKEGKKVITSKVTFGDT